MVEIALEIAPLALPTIAKEVQPTNLSILALLAKLWLVIIDVVDKEGPDIMGLSMIQVVVEVLPTTTKFLIAHTE